MHSTETDIPTCTPNVLFILSGTVSNIVQKLGNGLLIQWGTLEAGANTLTFPQPFAYKLYYIGALPNYTGVIGNNSPSFQNKTTTGCTIHASTAYSVDWIAVGCWYL